MTPTHPRILRDRDRFRKWYLDEDVKLTMSNGDVMTIPKGYRFDAHSVPFGLRWIFPKDSGNDLYAAMVHDYLIDMSPFLRYTRKQQDAEYTRFMNMPEYFTSKFRKRFMPLAVRVAGFLKHDLWGDFRGDSNKYLTRVVVIVNQEER